MSYPTYPTDMPGGPAFPISIADSDGRRDARRAREAEGRNMRFNESDHVLICGDPYTVVGTADLVVTTGFADRAKFQDLDPDLFRQQVCVQSWADEHVEFWDSADLARHQIPWIKDPGSHRFRRIDQEPIR